MESKKKIIIAVVAIAVVAIVIALIALTLGKSNSPKLSMDLTKSDLVQSFIEKIYENSSVELPALQTQVVDLEDEYSLKSFTGLDDKSKIEFAIASEPLMTGQAYSLVFVKVKDGENVEEVKQSIFDNVDCNKWICVSAEKLAVTNYGNTVVLLMADADYFDGVNSSIQSLVGSELGSRLEKVNEI